MAATLSELHTKLDAMLAKENQFTDDEEITLRHLVDAYDSMSWFVRVAKNASMAVALVVLIWTNWEKLLVLIGGKP